MSINNIQILTMNPHFFSLLMQSFLSGYEKPCKIKLVFMMIPILLYADAREKLISANKKSRVDTLFKSGQTIGENTISGKSRLSGYIDRYNILKPYCKEAVIIMFSENKVVIYNHEIIIIEKINYRNYDQTIKIWLKCAYYLGIIFSKASEDHLCYLLGVDKK